MPRTAGLTDDPPTALARIGSRWPELTVLLVGQTIASLATAVVSVAAPAVGGYLHLAGADLQLVVSGYGLTYTALLVFGARLGDHGYRRVFLVGVGMFTVAGLVSGLAPNALVLTVGQLLQGAGSAMLIPQVLSLIQLRFVGRARSLAVSLYSMMLGFAVAIGAVLGGVLATVDMFGLTWRPVFLVNVPIGLALLAAGRRWLPRDGRASVTRLDLRGAVLFTTAIALIVIGLIFGPVTGWPAWTWAVTILGAVVVGVFVVLEVRYTAVPLLDLRILRVAGVASGLLGVLILMGGYGTLLYTLSAYLQNGLGYSVLASGLVFATYAVGFGAVNLTWGRLPRRLHRWVSPVAVALLCVAEVVLGMVLRSGMAPGVVIPALIVAGMGHGAGFGALVDRVAAHLPARHGSAFSGLVNTITQLSILLGIAVVGGLYLHAARADGRHGYLGAMSTVCFGLAAAAAVAFVACLALSVRLPDPDEGEVATVH